MLGEIQVFESQPNIAIVGFPLGAEINGIDFQKFFSQRVFGEVFLQDKMVSCIFFPGIEKCEFFHRAVYDNPILGDLLETVDGKLDFSGIDILYRRSKGDLQLVVQVQLTIGNIAGKNESFYFVLIFFSDLWFRRRLFRMPGVGRIGISIKKQWSCTFFQVYRTVGKGKYLGVRGVFVGS